MRGKITEWTLRKKLGGFISAEDNNVYRLSIKHSFGFDDTDIQFLHNIHAGLPVEFEPAPLTPGHDRALATNVRVLWKEYREKKKTRDFKKEKEQFKPISSRGEMKVYGESNVVPRSNS